MKQHVEAVKKAFDDCSEINTALFQKYVLPYQKMIYIICLQRTINKQYVEDNYSDVLINLYKYVDTYDSSKSIKAWLYTVTLRLIIALNRKQSKLNISRNVDIENAACCGDSGAMNYCFFDADRYRDFYSDEVIWALGKLSPIHRETLLLHQAGYKMTEIAEIAFQNGTLQSKNPKTIKSRLFFAKKHMKDLLTNNIIKK